LFGIKLLWLFLASGFIGSFAEFIIGLAYHKILNKRLWIYDKFNIKGYTSWLSFPLWCIGGVIFWFFGKIIGL
jgi:uncharacterized membrane protein